MWNPWAHLRAHRRVALTMRPLPTGTSAYVDFDDGHIYIDTSLLQRERNDALAHELTHLERGRPVARFEDAEERAVNEEVARRLIPLDELVQALRWSRNPTELAEDLNCTESTVLTRLARLTPDEARSIRSELGHDEFA